MSDLTIGDSHVRKCSRCRVKRMDEEADTLIKYATCTNCRNKRKIETKANKSRSFKPVSRYTPSVEPGTPNLFTDFEMFLDRIKNNQIEDVLDHHYKSISPEELFKRYHPAEVTNDVFAMVSKQLVATYLEPIMLITGFRFATRDYHKGGTKTKKVTFMFICSQDRTKQRKSRSDHKRQIINKLKVEECHSKVSMSYDLTNGVIQLGYNHRHHPPYSWSKKDFEMGNHHHHDNSVAAIAAAAAATHSYHNHSDDSMDFSKLEAMNLINSINNPGFTNYLQQATDQQLQEDVSHFNKVDDMQSSEDPNVDDELKRVQRIKHEIDVDNIDQELIRQSY